MSEHDENPSGAQAADTSTTDAAPADPADAPDQASDSATASATSPVYRRRRLVRNGALVAAAFVAGYLLLPDILGGPQNTAGPLNDPAGDPVLSQNLLQDAQKSAVETLSVDGTLDQWVPDAPVIGGGGGSSAVLSVVADGRCLYAGIIDGQPTGIQTDTTGAACSPAAVNEAVNQLRLDATVETEVNEQVELTPSAAVDAAVATARFWVVRNVDASGQPSFVGIEPQLFAPVAIMVENNGSSLLLVDPNAPCPAVRVLTDTTATVVQCPQGAG